jgi:hypothetical protein
VAEEGVEALASGVLEGGAEDPGAEVEEAVEGEIRDTILGAYSFIF